jgi:hypothetical protein
MGKPEGAKAPSKTTFPLSFIKERGKKGVR